MQLLKEEQGVAPPQTDTRQPSASTAAEAGPSSRQSSPREVKEEEKSAEEYVTTIFKKKLTKYKFHTLRR